MIVGTLNALKILHDAGLINRDIKPENLVYNDNHEVSFIDLDTTIKIEEQSRYSGCGTPAYKTKQLRAEQSRHSKTSDLVAMARVIFNLLQGKLYTDRNQLKEAAFYEDVATPTWESRPPSLNNFGLLTQANYQSLIKAYQLMGDEENTHITVDTMLNCFKLLHEDLQQPTARDATFNRFDNALSEHRAITAANKLLMSYQPSGSWFMMTKEMRARRYQLQTLSRKMCETDSRERAKTILSEGKEPFKKPRINCFWYKRKQTERSEIKTDAIRQIDSAISILEQATPTQ